MNWKTWDVYKHRMLIGIHWKLYCTSSHWLEYPEEVLDMISNGHRLFVRGTGLLDRNGTEIFEQDYLWYDFQDARYEPGMCGPVEITPNGVQLGVGLPSESHFFTVRGNVFIPMFGGARIE